MEWLLVFSLLVVAIIFLLWPLWRRDGRPLPKGEEMMEETAQERQEEKTRLLANLSVLRQEYAEGKMTKEDFSELEAEYQQQLAAILDSRGQPHIVTPATSRTSLHRAGSVALLLIVSLSSLLLFNHFWKEEPPAQSPHELDIDAMMRHLEGRLATNPDDIDGQIMMARSYAALGRNDDAKRAWRKALQLEPANAEAKGELAVLLLQTGNKVEVREALSYIAQLRQADPTEPSWLWYQSMGEDLLGQHDEARATLEKLLPMLPPDSDKAAMVKKALAQMTPTK